MGELKSRFTHPANLAGPSEFNATVKPLVSAAAGLGLNSVTVDTAVRINVPYYASPVCHAGLHPVPLIISAHLSASYFACASRSHQCPPDEMKPTAESETLGHFPVRRTRNFNRSRGSERSPHLPTEPSGRERGISNL